MYGVDTITDEIVSHGRLLYNRALCLSNEASQETGFYGRLNTDKVTEIFGILDAAAYTLEEELADENSVNIIKQPIVLYQGAVLDHMIILKDCYERMYNIWLAYPFTEEEKLEQRISTAKARQTELKDKIEHFKYISMQ